MESSPTRPTPPRELAIVWRELRNRIGAVLDGASDTLDGSEIVRAAGDDVRLIDVVAHMRTYLARFGPAGRTSDSPTACAAVAVRTNLVSGSAALTDAIQGWRDEAAAVEAQLSGADPAAVVELICEDVQHEHDLRMTLGCPGDRDSEAIKIALVAMSEQLSERVARARLPALRITVEQWGTELGDGVPKRCVVADRYEFVRAMGGRRSRSEVLRWNWSDGADDYPDVISATGSARAEELQERDPRVPADMRDREFVL